MGLFPLFPWDSHNGSRSFTYFLYIQIDAIQTVKLKKTIFFHMLNQFVNGCDTN